MRNQREQGTATLFALALLMISFALGMALIYFSLSGRSNGEDYYRETQLYTAAESELRRAAVDVMQNGTDAPSGKIQMRYSMTTDDVTVRVYEKRSNDTVYLYAYAEPNKDDGWRRHLEMKGYLTKRGDRYVWMGFFL